MSSAIIGAVVVAGGAVAAASPEPRVWQLFRPVKPLADPDTKETLGYEAQFLGTARLTQTGVPSSFLVLTSKMEIQRDDLLAPAPPQDVPSYIPRAPARNRDMRRAAGYVFLCAVAAAGVFALAGRFHGAGAVEPPGA